MVKGRQVFRIADSFSKLYCCARAHCPQATGAIPTLAGLLYDQPEIEYINMRLYSAWSMAQILERDWPGADLRLKYDRGGVRFAGDGRPEKDQSGRYLLVNSARQWWEQEGRELTWPPLKPAE